MKRILSALLMGAIGSVATAEPVFHPAGSNLVFGVNNASGSVISSTNNPAGGVLAAARGDSKVRFGVLSSIGAGYELGKVDNFVQDINDLSKQLNQTNLTLNQANTIINQFNSVLTKAGQEGYLNFHVGVQAPLMPMMISSSLLGGVVSLDFNGSAIGRVSILDAPLVYNPISQAVETNSAAYIKGATQIEGAVGYGRPVWKSDAGSLFAGVRAKYYQLSLAKNVIGLANTNSDLGKSLQDEFDRNTKSSGALGLDIGVLWASERYELGATVKNLNKPSFDYGTVGQDCATLTGAAQTNCYTAASFANRIDLKETYTMDPQARLEASVHSPNRRWIATTAYDTSAVRDPVGNQVQWLVAGLGYTPDSLAIPGLRVGYRANMAGNQLSYATAGLTLFSLINLDVAYGLESVSVDGKTYPRAAMINLGIGARFF